MTKMKLLAVACFIFIIFFSGYQKKIPKSVRSRKAVEKCLDKLEPEFLKAGLKLGNPVFIRILKNEYMLEVWVKNGYLFSLFKSYQICSYSGGLGTKTKQGDRKSPEGFYFVEPRQLNPYSSFHLSFNIGYPNRYERMKKYTGSALMVHGNCVSAGCYAMGNENIEEIWTIIDAAFRGGQNYFRIHIFPFRMTEENMKKFNTPNYKNWQFFWENLKEGYDWFEEKRRPPNVLAQQINKEIEYVFN